MGWTATTPSPWTEDAEERLVTMRAAGQPSSAIATALGVSRSAVMGRLHRLRARGDDRAGPPPPNPVSQNVVRRLAEMNRLADAWADGAPTLGVAASAAGLTYDRAAALWAAIRADLGWQAR